MRLEATISLTGPERVSLSFTPRTLHCSISVLITAMTSMIVGVASLKTQLFLNFQMVHAIMRIMDRIPFLWSASVLLTMLRQISVEEGRIRSNGFKAEQCLQEVASVQTAREKGQSQIRCREDSKLRTHNGQK